jgi:septal ring factor EnvC (AmiA/AmiB activator)
MRPLVLAAACLLAVPLGLGLVGGGAAAQLTAAYATADETRAAMRLALRERQQAEARSNRLEREAASASTAAERTAREAAAMAARIQQAEAGIAAAGARIALVDRERRILREDLGRQQRPLVQLTAALQQFSRRPAVLSILRPGTIRDLVHTRALLAAATPHVEERTEALRSRMARSSALRTEAQQAITVLRAEEARLTERRSQLATLEARQRIASRAARGSADREAERALALAEQTRDLDALIGELDRAGSLRATLAALPGPLPRPANPSAAVIQPEAPATAPSAGLRPFSLPVTGRLVAGFGVPLDVGTSKGLTLAPRGGAQVVAPAAGRVAFAGPYRGYARIVIIEHPGGWTTLVTGLARTDVQVGDDLVGGAPLGVAQQGNPLVTLELRSAGVPVDPLPFVG